MKNLLKKHQLLITIFCLLISLFSCNNEELFVIDTSTLVEEIPEEETEEETNTEDEAPQIDAVDDTVTTIENISVDIEAYLNDTNLPTSITVTNTNPSDGVLSINNNNTPRILSDDTVVYTPNSGFSGIDSFDYTVCDATNSENCDTATVTITITSRENDFATELKAFPDAYGAGAFSTTGGRGGEVIHVTNLNSSGPGSFREALYTEATRTIVFDVSGEIYIPNEFSFYGYSLDGDFGNYGNLTIAGETAPAGGITFTGYGISIGSSDNIIIRYIRNRGSGAQDLISMRGGSNLVIDHCSFAWAGDEAISVNGNYTPAITNVTIQNCLFYNNKTAMIIGSNGDSASGTFSILRNASSSTSHRFPKGAGDAEVDIINNLIHNWKIRAIRMDAFDYKINQIGNYYQSGSNTISSSSSSGTGIFATYTNNTMSPQIYMEDNHIDQDILNIYGHSNYQTNPSVAWFKFNNSTVEPKATWVVNNQLPLQGAVSTILSAASLKTEILPKVGACQTLNADGSINFWRDSLDEIAVDEIQNDSGATIIRTDAPEYRSNPTYTSVTRPAGYDTDQDGMADIWEIATFGDLTKTAIGDHDGDGYTNIEEFLILVDKK